MSPDEFMSLIAFRHERTDLEFKTCCSSGDRAFAAKLVRAMLAMANHEGGGTVIFGIYSRDGSFRLDGCSPEIASEWSFDALATLVGGYADPSVEFTVQQIHHESLLFVCIEVREFAELPILCRKDYPDILRRGACYVRTLGKAETAEVAGQTEFRNLLDRATTKQVQRFFRQYAQTPALERDRASSDVGRFNEEELRFRTTDPLAAQITQRGWWRVVVRPETYSRDRIADVSRLRQVLTTSAGRGNGISFPRGTQRGGAPEGINYVEGQLANAPALEAWRFYQSGQLVSIDAFWDDWKENPESTATPADGAERRRRFEIDAAVRHVTLAFEYAARLASALEGEDGLCVLAEANNLSGRRLGVGDDFMRDFIFEERVAKVDAIPLIWSGPRTELVGRWLELSAERLRLLFKYFDWNVQPREMQGLQERAIGLRADP